MRRALPPLIVLSLGFAPVPVPRERSKSDRDRMQGSWVEDHTVRDETRALVDLDFHFRGDKVTCNGNLYVVTLDAGRRPPRFDMVGLTDSIKGNRIRVCTDRAALLDQASVA
jgi:hypothetical protein